MTDPQIETFLSENRLNVLETYHRRCLRFLLYQLDDAFTLKPHPEADSSALGFRLIALLRASDAKPFEMICQGVLHSMLRTDMHLNPYVAAAMALMGMTRNKLFEEVLRAVRDESEPEGPVLFGAKELGGEGPGTTLWNLELLRTAGRESDHTSVIEPALRHLAAKASQVMEESPALSARLAAAATRFPFPDGGETRLAKKSLEDLLARRRENGRWGEGPEALGMEAETAAALLEAAPVLGSQARSAAEAWLDQVFHLSGEGELPEWPDRKSVV